MTYWHRLRLVLHVRSSCPTCRAWRPCGVAQQLYERAKGIDYVRYLLDTYDLWSLDGHFTFPDGEAWVR